MEITNCWFDTLILRVTQPKLRVRDQCLGACHTHRPSAERFPNPQYSWRTQGSAALPEPTLTTISLENNVLRASYLTRHFRATPNEASRCPNDAAYSKELKQVTNRRITENICTLRIQSPK